MKLILFVSLLFLKLSLTSYAFEGSSSSPSSSFSNYILNSLSADQAITSEIKTGLMSSSIFGAMFSKVELFSTAIEFRGCDCGKAPVVDQIKSYVDGQYAGYPEPLRKKMLEAMIQGRKIEETLRVKMFNPDLSDQEVMIYGVEREKLLRNLWGMETKANQEYSRTVKPSKYSDVLHDLASLEMESEGKFFILRQKIFYILRQKNYDVSSDRDPPSPRWGTQASLKELVFEYQELEEKNQELRAELVISLMSYPVEARILEMDDDIDKHGEIRRNWDSIVSEFYKYLDSISTPKRMS